MAIVLMVSGCAVVEIPQEDPAAKPFAPIESSRTNQLVDHGVITVAQVQPRSDIIVLPPSVEHVVWRRGEEILADEAVEVPDRAAKVSATARTTARRVRDNWPLLEEDLNFESEIGRLEMCDRQTPCGPDEYCDSLEPCEEPEKYDCFSVKMGEYCLEAEK
jgi:hypothetical protein